MLLQKRIGVISVPIHQYIPNSVPEIRKNMLQYLGVKDIEELFVDIPEMIKWKKRLRLPHPTPELQVKRNIEGLLSKNKNCNEILAFLGAGCWPHYVPAVCDEISSRSEFLTAYTGDVYTDLGRYQALFEFQSMIGDLIAMDVVSFPTYDWATASGDAAHMAVRITGRHEILVPKTMSPERLSVIKTYCERLAEIKPINYDPITGQLDLKDLKKKISERTAAVYIENPAYLGFIETEGGEIGKIAHDNRALYIVGVEPLSLGLLTPPGEYGADIVCGEGQPLGIHMNFGGGLFGFLACRDEEQLVSVMPHRMITVTSTEQEDEWGFAYTLPRRTMFAAREKATTFTGTATVLWAITAAVYMSLLGPKGISELAEVIMQKAYYAMRRISEIDGVIAPIFKSPHFKEFTVNFGADQTVSEVNKNLLKHGIQGGKDITKEFPQLGNTALYCVTEIHMKEDIDRLVAVLEDIIK
jgi:glycine dehydrogenase subunit 1